MATIKLKKIKHTARKFAAANYATTIKTVHREWTFFQVYVKQLNYKLRARTLYK